MSASVTQPAKSPAAVNPAADSLLLHVCCGPCSIMPVRRLQDAGYAVTAWFMNPNIQPLGEYFRRREAAGECAERLGIPILYEDAPWNLVEWLRQVAGRDLPPERCGWCCTSRMEATWAAARYLKDMYDIYKDWNLVIAAYNCGPGNINKAIRRAGGKTDYWEIYNFLPRETRGYVPAFIAANYVMTYYCKHNICPMETNIPEVTDTVQVDKQLHFQQIADICHLPLEEIKSLNPQYKRNVIPGHTKPQTLRLPLDAISSFIDNQDTIYAHRQQELFKNRRLVAVSDTRPRAVAGKGKPTIYKIRRGDTLGQIAERFHVRTNDIRLWNGIVGNRITAGKTLKIYNN